MSSRRNSQQTPISPSGNQGQDPSKLSARKLSARKLSARRLFLKSAVAAMSLPALESITPQVIAKELPASTSAQSKRMVCIGNSFGMYQPDFFPKTVGTDYEMPKLLKPLERHRADFTVFSNLDHGIKGGHFSVHSFLSGVKFSNAKSMPSGNITLDQRAAEVVGVQTRFPSLTIGSADGLHGGCQMSWTRTGVRVPPITGPKELFQKLFGNVPDSTKGNATDRFRLHGSILDAIGEQANSLGRRVSRRDQQKLDEYFSSIRDVERRIQQRQRWLSIPKPKPPIGEPTNENLVDDIPELYELIALALETDSTRIASLELAGADFKTSILGIKKGYHSLSHHGKDPNNIRDLVELETYQMQQLGVFIDRLKSIKTPDANGSLLDQTAVMFGSGMGNANSHTNTDLPIIVAGGGYRLGEHRVMPSAKHKRVPLCNLFLSLLHRLGIEDESFGLSDGTFDGLEMRS